MKNVRETVLAALAREDRYLTGAELARRLGVTRSAVWKAVEELRAEGEVIDAERRLGYRLTPGEGLRPSRLLRELPSLSRVECHRVIGSTNTRAKELAAAGAEPWTVVLAEEQSAGRGRYTRSFRSAPGCGIYLSVIVRPGCSAGDSPLLTTCAAVAVAEAIESLCPVSVKIKWVNDLWLAGRKICGILTEGGVDADSGLLDYAVIGIGLNVLHTDFPPELSDIATTIEDASGIAPDRMALTVAILRALQERLSHFADGSFLSDYRARSALDGRAVIVRRGEERYEATVRGIGARGELLLTLPDGTPATLSSGEVVSVRPR